jgi:hypothetical protein
VSDEHLINVEDDTPEAPVASAAAGEPSPDPVAAGAPEPDGDLDLNAVDVKDERQAKGLIGEVSRLRATIRDLKTQAERAATLEHELNQARPYLDFVRTNPHLLQPRPAEPDRPAAPDVDPDAVEAARLMDFYKADGSPDVERGARWLALQDKRSNRVAQTTIQPLQQASLQERAQANYTMLRNFKLADGKPLRQDIVDDLWRAAAKEQNGLATLANPDSVRALALLAMGAQALTQPAQPAAPAQPPIVTEASGGRASLPAARLSAIEERTIAQKGLSAAKYHELTKGFQPGRSNVLEED